MFVPDWDSVLGESSFGPVVWFLFCIISFVEDRMQGCSGTAAARNL